MTVAQFTYRLMKDETFRSQVLANPKAALELAHVNLTNENVELLGNIAWDNLLPGLELQDSPFIPDGPGWWDCQLNRFTPPSPSLLA